MLYKGIVALGIFIVLLVGAHYVFEDINRYNLYHNYDNVENDESIQIKRVRPLDEQDLYIEPVVEPFAPREYIRIRERVTQ